ncbi:SGNH/GDSL hydrolase family protein [Nonomuraea sp. NPDC048826]|uniref:SGNH/GDSL hydrolase family protein n=1 Tax=Nonomuraea sp. NPDC048826 TaxID=3364347 RepID=UPI003714D696
MIYPRRRVPRGLGEGALGGVWKGAGAAPAGTRKAARVAVAALLGASLAVAAVPAGVHAGLACAFLDAGCPVTEEPAGRLPQVTRLTAAEVTFGGAYVALGDSYSSGEGVYRPEDARVDDGAGRCHRAVGSYAPLVAGAHPFGGGTGFWACSGATTGQLLRGQHGQRPQVERVGAGTSLVTLSIGGNDAGFAPVLTGCIIKLPWSSACVDQDAEVRRRIGELRAGMRAVLSEIRVRAPEARIVLLGYPRPFPASPSGSVNNLGVADQRWLNDMTRRLNDVVREVAGEFDRAIVAFGGPGSVEYVDAYEAFDGHEVGRPHPYLNGLILDVQELTVDPRSFHPTAAGYRRFAELINERIAAGPGRPMNNVLVSTR